MGCFVRYVVVHQTSVARELRAAIPNLVLAVESGCIMLNHHFTILKVYRPVSYSTVLAVLEVPVQHRSPVVHSRCAANYTGQLEYVPGKLLPDCAVVKALVGDEWDFGYARPVDVVSEVELHDTGVIHGNSPAHHQKVFSNILLPGASVGYNEDRSSVKADDRSRQYVTAIQLLKMSATPSPPSRSGDDAQTSRFVEKENTAIKVWRSDCLYKPRYRAWHLSLTLREDEVDDFVYQVSLADRD